ncbi:MAG: TetR/AcrR family transcriptional regulator [Betaproteobacteria bacterium]|jgi:AcrR family transcriptional regulator
MVMGTAERRAREREEIRGRILKAARCLFAEEGYDAVTLRRVAEAIEYSPAAIYKYFADKDEMVRALVSEDMAYMLASFRPALAKCSLVERLKTFGRAYMNIALERPNHYRLMFMTPMPDRSPGEGVQGQVSDPNQDSYVFFLNAIQECIDAGLFRQEFRDAHLVAQTLWCGLHGIAALHITSGSKTDVPWRDVRRRSELMLDVLLRGMLEPALTQAGTATLTSPG